ncbi:MAG: hypothetical protein ABIQ93_16240 [Saprospiraceae bacterium]
MRYFTPLFASLLVLSTLLLWCCTQSAPRPEGMTTTKKATPFDSCSVDAIDSTTAMSEKNAWLSKRAALIAMIAHSSPGDSIFLAKSFRLHKCDIVGMMNALTDTTAYRSDSIWATLAIRNNQVTLIFHDFDLKGKKEVYYDFSRPCPPGVCE